MTDTKVKYLNIINKNKLMIIMNIGIENIEEFWRAIKIKIVINICYN